MRISNTVKITNLFVLGCLVGIPLAAAENPGLKQAQEDIRQSERYYQSAVNIYKELLRERKDPDRLTFELGRLYYSHGEFKQAIEEFKNSKQPEAKKFLAISYYRLGQFRDALEVFNNFPAEDDGEFLYYAGLTCEKLNLFDPALDYYGKIKGGPFRVQALESAQAIERQGGPHLIKDIDPRVSGLLSAAGSAEEYPEAGALIVFCDEKIEVKPQGTQVSELHYLIKILNERGKADFSETQIDYDSTFEKIELEYARTIKPDGSVVDVGSRHIRDVSKYMNFPLYSNVRVHIISFPEISEGCAIEYKLKVHNNRLINKKDFVSAYTVQAGEPVLRANFEVSLPKDNPLHIKILNKGYDDFGADLDPKIQEKESALTYSWSFSNIPQIIPEVRMPPSSEINPTILLSTFDNWQEIYGWWWEMAKDKIKAQGAIKSQVKELTRGLKSEEEKIRAVYNFCAQKVRYVAVEYGEAGYEPHTAEDIFRNKYGDCKDQAILLVTMLKEAGLSAWPVLIATKEHYNLNQDFPSVLFNHCIAAVSLKGKTYFLDPTAETCPFRDLPMDDQARRVLLFKEDRYEILETDFFPPEHNRVRQVYALQIDPQETIKGEKSVQTFGFYDQAQRYWLLYTQPELIQETLKQKVQEVSIGGKLKGYRIENLENLNKPVVLYYDFQGPEFFTLAGDLRILPQFASVDTSLTAKDKRRYPIDFGLLETTEIEEQIEIPQGFEIKYIPKSLEQESPWIRYLVEYGVKGKKIHVKQRSVVKRPEVRQEEYSAFKRFIEETAKKVKERIVLEKKG